MILAILAGLAAAFSISGGVRVDSAKDRLKNAADRYREIVSSYEKAKGRLNKALQTVGTHATRSIESLKLANRMLTPLKRGFDVPKAGKSTANGKLALDTLSKSALTVTSYKEIVLAGGVGLGVGSAAAAGSWVAVSTLGAASTGTAIASLHGVAATNAILASLGHGALAVGGGGMAAGAATLGGIVLLPVAAFVGFAAHAKADEINEKAVEIEKSNRDNSKTLAIVEEQVPDFEQLISRISSATDELETSVTKAKSLLFRRGFLSRVYKRFRLWITGAYYTKAEMRHVDDLRAAIDRFLNVIGADRRAYTREGAREPASILKLKCSDSTDNSSFDGNAKGIETEDRGHLIWWILILIGATGLCIILTRHSSVSLHPPTINSRSTSTSSDAGAVKPSASVGPKLAASPLPTMADEKLAMLDAPSNAFPIDITPTSTQDRTESKRLDNEGLRMLSGANPDLAGARNDFERSFQMDSTNVEALNNLGYVYGRLGDYQTAESILLKVLDFSPNRKAAQGNLGAIQAELGKAQEAADHFCLYVHHFDSLEHGKSTLSRDFKDGDSNVKAAIDLTLANCS